MAGRRRVLVAYGGRSSEHPVSCLSAKSVLDVIDRERFDVLPVGITRDGRWRLTDGVIEPSPGSPLPEVAPDAGDPVTLIQSDDGAHLLRLDGDAVEDLGNVDVAFPVLHGPYGEDGAIQGYLTTVGVPYVGADVTASSVGIDKRAMKLAFKARGLPQVPYLPVTRARWDRERTALVDEIEGALSYPMFTKPARQGSSIGITMAHHREELIGGLAMAFEFDRTVIVEQGLDRPREVEVGALGNDDVEITAPGEIVPAGEFYTFEAKYLDDSQLHVPADVDDATADRIREIAEQAWLAIGCRGMARIDFFLERDGSLYLNEINTIPGFTPSSMLPMLWQAEGVSYPQLVARLLDLAMAAALDDARLGG